MNLPIGGRILNSAMKKMSWLNPFYPYKLRFDMYNANIGTPITFNISNKQILNAILN